MAFLNESVTALKMPNSFDLSVSQKNGVKFRDSIPASVVLLRNNCFRK